MARHLDRFARSRISSLVTEAVHYDLAESVGPNLRLADLLEGDKSLAELEDMAISYSTPAGALPLREAIAARHGVDAGDVVVTLGGMQALFLLSLVLCRQGDEVVMTTPLFPNALESIRSAGAEVRMLQLSFDSAYRVEPPALQALLGPQTRMVALTTPQNPSGVAVPTADLEAILEAMRATCPEAVLLVDETYREAAYGDDAVAPSAAALDARVVTVASLSKCHGAPGLRTGWLICRDPELREQLVLGKFYSSCANPTLDELLATRVLARQDSIIATRRAHLQDGLARTAAWVAANDDLIEWVRPSAGALCCLRLRPGHFDAAAVERFQAEQRARDVRVAPGSWFGEEDRVVRLGFGLLPMAELDVGLARLADALRAAAAPIAAAA